MIIVDIHFPSTCFSCPFCNQVMTGEYKGLEYCTAKESKLAHEEMDWKDVGAGRIMEKCLLTGNVFRERASDCPIKGEIDLK